jgi:RHS repeat-associated protein
MDGFNKYLTLLLLVCSLFLTRESEGQTIVGPTPVAFNSTQNYSLYDDVIYTSPNWSLSSGGGIISQSHVGLDHYVQVQWTEPGVHTLSFWDGSTQVHTKNVTVNCPSIPKPTTTFNITQNCGSTDITRVANPPANTTWYWQTSSSGTDINNSTNLYTTTSSSGPFYVRARHSTYTGCWSGLATATSTITINQNPANYNVGGGGSYCSGGSGLSITLSSSQSGVNYQLRLDGANTGSSVAGTGSALSWPNQTTAGTYTVMATDASTGCYTLMNGNPTVSINPLPTLYTVGGGGGYCSGGTGVTVSLSGAQSGVYYQLKRGSTDHGSQVPGQGNPLYWTNITATGTYTVVATNATTSCVQTMTGSSEVIINPLPTSYSVGGGGAYCSGGGGVSVTLSDSDTGVNYQLLVGGSNSGSSVAGTGSMLTWTGRTTAGNYTVVATNASTGCVQTMTSSATVSINQLPSLFTVGGGGAYCSGASGVSVTLSDSESGINYQLKVGGSDSGSAVAGTGNLLTWTDRTTAGNYTVVATNVSTGCVQTMSSSATVSINPLPTQFTVGGGGAYCSGGSGVSVTLSDSDTGVNYQLKVGGSNSGSAVAGTGAALTWTDRTTAGSYTVEATNAGTGCVQTMSSSATVSINPLPTQFTVSGGGSYCSGGSGVSVMLSDSDTGVNYQLQIGTVDNGAPVGGTGSAITWTNRTTSGLYKVVATNASTGCVQLMSSGATVSINPLPTQFTVGGGGAYCSGGSGVSITLTDSDTGVNYQLKVDGSNNGSPVAGTGNSLTWADRTTAGSYTVVATHAATSCEQAMTGNSVVIINTAPVITNNSPGNYIPYGSSISMSTQSFATYSWNRDGIAVVGANQQHFAANEPGSYTITASYATAPNCTSAPLVVYSTTLYQPQPVNMVSTTVVMREGLNESSSLHSLKAREVSQTISYADGLGRAFQTIAVGQSPQYGDIVSHAGFTRHGLMDSTFLPYTTATADGRLQVNAIRGSTAYNSYSTSAQYMFHQNTARVKANDRPYGQTEYRNNPGMRPYKQGAPGQDWQISSTHIVTSDIEWNNPSYPVRRWNSDGTSTGNYANNTVAVSITKDENGNKVHTYTNNLGQTVLKQVQKGPSTWLDTYYVYDEFGRLKYQVPPKAVIALVGTPNLETDANLAELIYKYTYDIKGRVIIKKVPGAAEEHIVYDKLDRIVLTQDGNQRTQGRWMFVKYDERGRSVYSGFHVNGDSRTTLQAAFDAIDYNSSPWFETEQVNSTYHGYSNTVYPTGNLTLLSVNYYDHYNFDRSGGVDFTYDASHFSGQDAAASTRTRGMATGSKKAIIDAAGNVTSNWLVSVVFYDQYDRPIQTQSSNHLYLSVADKSTVIYNFKRAVKSKTTHYSSAGTSVFTVTRNVYDHAGRLLRTYHSINGAAEQVLAAYEYNALGQLVEKNLHCTSCPADVNPDPGSDEEEYLERSEYRIDETQLVATEGIRLLPGFKVAAGQTLTARTDVSQAGAVEEFADGANYLQSVDYRYNERGWLSSINNSQLNINSANNDDEGDYFGMEIAYNTAAGMSNTLYYNGNVSAVKWKGVGLGSGATDQRSYKFEYDSSDRLKDAIFQAYTGSAWTREANTLNESMTYDVNGNIMGLTRSRNLRGLSVTTVTSTPEIMDNLTYTYDSSNPNRLKKVEDAASVQAGFVNSVNTTTEYTYATDGSLNADTNKGVSSTTYNLLGKPQQITFSDGRTIAYTYAADGIKLSMAVTTGGNTVTTNYSGGFVYNNTTLSFFSSPEGRVVKNGSNYEYQYAIADHQGNTRVVFSSATPAPEGITANMEASTNSNFLNYPTGGNRSSLNLYDNTDAGTTYTYSNLLNAGNNSQVGVAKSYKVYPGEKVKIEAYAKYSNVGSTPSNIAGFAAALLSAFGVSPPGVGETGTIASALDTWGGLVADGDGGTSSGPKAFVNIIIFDKNYNLLDAAWEAIDPAAEQIGASPVVAHDFMMREYIVKEEGYAFLYISNENETQVDVYFDDVVMTHTMGNVIQYNEYYPFGLQTANSWTRENTTGNNFLGNGGTEMNATSSLYDLAFRNYDPVLCRMNAVDPMASKYASLTPYNFSFNDPMTFNDPSGAEPPTPAYGGAYFDFAYGSHYTRYTYDDRVDYHYSGAFHVGGGTADALAFHTGGRSSGLIDWSYAPSTAQLQAQRESARLASNFVLGVAAALESKYGGSVNLDAGVWGRFSFCQDAFAVGLTYNKTHNSWNSTEFGSLEGSVVAFAVAMESGLMPTRGEVDAVLNPLTASSAGPNPDPWYVTAFTNFMDNIWNSNTMRRVVPDQISFDITVGGGMFRGSFGSYTAHLLTRGSSPGLYVSRTFYSPLTSYGAGVGYGLNLGIHHYRGPAHDISPGTLQGKSMMLTGGLGLSASINTGYRAADSNLLDPLWIGVSGGFGDTVGGFRATGNTEIVGFFAPVGLTPLYVPLR